MDAEHGTDMVMGAKWNPTAHGDCGESVGAVTCSLRANNPELSSMDLKQKELVAMKGVANTADREECRPVLMTALEGLQDGVVEMELLELG